MGEKRKRGGKTRKTEKTQQKQAEKGLGVWVRANGGPKESAAKKSLQDGGRDQKGQREKIRTRQKPGP